MDESFSSVLIKCCCSSNSSAYLSTGFYNLPATTLQIYPVLGSALMLHLLCDPQCRWLATSPPGKQLVNVYNCVDV